MRSLQDPRISLSIESRIFRFPFPDRGMKSSGDGFQSTPNRKIPRFMTEAQAPRPEPSPPPAGRWRGIVFGLAVGLPTVLIGVVFVVFLYLAYERARQTRSWTPRTCVIEQSAVTWDRTTTHSPIRYRAHILYRYRIAGQSHSSARIKRVDGSSADKKTIERSIADYPPGSTHTCFVDPGDHSFAILEHAPLAPIYTIWFPSLFILGGIGIIIGSIRRSARERDT